MKPELEKLDTLAGDFDYLLNEGVCITKEDRDNTLFILQRITNAINEMPVVP